MKKYSISAVTALALSTAGLSQTVELQTGWNLINFPQTPSDSQYFTKTQLQNQLGSKYGTILTFDTDTNGNPAIKTAGRISTLESNKGYWLKVTEDSSVTFEDGVVTFPTLVAGWNLVGIGNLNSRTDLTNHLNSTGFKYETMLTFDNVNGNPAIKTAGRISTLNDAQGYWLKVSKEVGVATTRDGYRIALYVDKSNVDTATLIQNISNYTLSQLNDTRLNFSDISHVVASGTVGGTQFSTVYLDPNSTTFVTSLTSAITNARDAAQRAASGDVVGDTDAALYIYGINSGGAPYMLSSVDVYSVNTDGTKGSLIGSTNATGYLYIATKPTNGKVILEKDGYISTVQTLSTSSGANYMFITADDGAGLYLGGGGDINNTSVAATRARAISSDAGSILVPPYFFERSNSHGVRIMPANTPISVFPDVGTLNTEVLEQTGYIVNELGRVFLASLVENRPNFTASFSEVFNRSSSATLQYNDFKGVISLRNLSEFDGILKDDNGNVTIDGVAELKSKIEVRVYNSNGWTRLNETDFNLFIKDENGTYIGATSTDTLSALERLYTGSNAYRNRINGIISINGSAMSGAYSAIAIFKEEVANTDTNFITYPLHVLVSNDSNEPLANSNVRLVRGSGGVELSATTGSDGIATFNLLSSIGANEAINLTALRSNYYTATNTISLSSLDSTCNDTNCNRVNMTLLSPPSYATVRGEIKDSTDSSMLPFSKVNLVYPIALAKVQKDVLKTIDNKDLRGIEVGAVPNAKYTWYIKAASTNVDTPTSNPARVSERRWIRLKSATSDQNGNFLSYSEVIGQALARPLDTDPTDVKIIPSGQFEIAVQVEHDIDSDGVYDFSELASTNASAPNLTNEQFIANPNNSYGRTLGFVSTSIDVEKLYADSADTQHNFTQYYVKSTGYNEGRWNLVLKDVQGNQELEYLGMSYYDNTSSMFSANEVITIAGNKARGILSINNIPGEFTTPDEISWNASISASLVSGDGDDFKNVVLVRQQDGSYIWQTWENESDFDVTNNDLLTLVGKFVNGSAVHTDRRFQLRKLSRFVSDNKILEKLAMTLQDIANEAGIQNFVLNHPQDRLFRDGFTIEIVPEVKVTHTQDDNITTNDVTFRTHLTLDFSGQDIRNYITLGDVFVQRPALFESTQSVFADRNGMYEFPAVPMDFGNFRNGNSFLRVESSRLGYFDSVPANVSSFTIDNPQTHQREDVRRVDVALQPKPVYSVTLAAVNSNGSTPLDDATITIDGIKQTVTRDNMRLSEAMSTATVTGSGTVENVLGGRGTNRVIRATRDGYLPVIQTIRNLNRDESITIEMTATTDVADSLAAISIANATVNYNTASANVSLRVSDMNDGSLTTSARVVAFVNGEMVNVALNRDGNLISANLPLSVGQNTIYFEVANSKGISRSSNINLEFRPDIGTVVGKVLAFTDSDNNNRTDSDKIVVVDFFKMIDSQPHYLNSQTVSATGEYIFQNIASGQAIALQAVELDRTTNRVTKRSSLVNVTVPSARTARNDLTLEALPTQIDGIVGAPVIEFVNAISNSQVQFTVSNYDNNANSKVGVYVNGVYIDLKSNMTYADSTRTYTTVVSNISLRPGENRIYGYAENITGDSDRTVERVVFGDMIANPTTFVIDGPSVAYIDVFDASGHLIAHRVASSGVAAEFNNVADGSYTVVVSAEGYESKRLTNVQFATNQSHTIEMIPESNTIEVPPFSISTISTNSNIFTKDVSFDASVAIVTEDTDMSGYSYSWSLSFDDGTTALSSTSATPSFVPSTSGYATLNVTVTKGDITREQSRSIYIQGVEIQTPPTPPVISGIPTVN